MNLTYHTYGHSLVQGSTSSHRQCGIFRVALGGSKPHMRHGLYGHASGTERKSGPITIRWSAVQIISMPCGAHICLPHKANNRDNLNTAYLILLKGLRRRTRGPTVRQPNDFCAELKLRQSTFNERSKVTAGFSLSFCSVLVIDSFSTMTLKPLGNGLALLIRTFFQRASYAV